MVLKTSLWQVGYMDEVVGNVTTQLKEKGMWDNVSAQTILPPFHIDRLSSLSPDAADRGCCYRHWSFLPPTMEDLSTLGAI